MLSRGDGTEKIVFKNNLKTTKILDEELSILTDFTSFLGEGTKLLAGSLDFTAFIKGSDKAYPILIENRSGNRICNKLQVMSISRQKTKDELYKVPIDYVKLDNPLGNRR